MDLVFVLGAIGSVLAGPARLLSVGAIQTGSYYLNQKVKNLKDSRTIQEDNQLKSAEEAELKLLASGGIYRGSF
jgi:hypothetical protein